MGNSIKSAKISSYSNEELTDVAASPEYDPLINVASLWKVWMQSGGCCGLKTIQYMGHGMSIKEAIDHLQEVLKKAGEPPVKLIPHDDKNRLYVNTIRYKGKEYLNPVFYECAMEGVWTAFVYLSSNADA